MFYITGNCALNIFVFLIAQVTSSEGSPRQVKRREALLQKQCHPAPHLSASLGNKGNLEKLEYLESKIFFFVSLFSFIGRLMRKMLFLINVSNHISSCPTFWWTV